MPDPLENIFQIYSGPVGIDHPVSGRGEIPLVQRLGPIFLQQRRPIPLEAQTRDSTAGFLTAIIRSDVGVWVLAKEFTDGDFTTELFF